MKTETKKKFSYLIGKTVNGLHRIILKDRYSTKDNRVEELLDTLVFVLSDNSYFQMLNAAQKYLITKELKRKQDLIIDFPLEPEEIIETQELSINFDYPFIIASVT